MKTSLHTHQPDKNSHKSKEQEHSSPQKLNRRVRQIYRNKALKVACHNINGIKSKGYKLENIVAWAEEEEVDILGIIETNINEKEGKCTMNRFVSEYKSFWANAKVDKKKGSGVGILIENKWEKHIGNIERINEFILTVRLYFKQMQLIIGVVYLPPNDKDLYK